MAEQEDKSSQEDAQEKLELKHPKQNQYFDQATLIYQGFCCPSWILHNVMAFQQEFQPQDMDIIVATKPKCGTTWLKSLVYSIVHRTKFTYSNHPLLTKNPHELIRSFEYDIYSTNKTKEERTNLMNSMISPRLFSTHLPCKALPESIKGQSKCKIVCMARNPFDTAVSSWKFVTQINPELIEQIPFDEFFESFCNGLEAFGPHSEHVLGYWNESLDRSDKVLFLKYEDMKEDGVSEMKKLAEFLGCGFSEEEEREGVIQEILRFCSFENLKNLEVNKEGSFNPYFKNKVYFRKGDVGDWANHLKPSMVEKLHQVMIEKFLASGLEFKIYSKNKVSI